VNTCARRRRAEGGLGREARIAFGLLGQYRFFDEQRTVRLEFAESASLPWACRLDRGNPEERACTPRSDFGRGQAESVARHASSRLDFHGRVRHAHGKDADPRTRAYRPLFIEEPVLAEQAECYPRLAPRRRSARRRERMYSRFEFSRVFEQVVSPSCSRTWRMPAASRSA